MQIELDTYRVSRKKLPFTVIKFLERILEIGGAQAVCDKRRQAKLLAEEMHFKRHLLLL